MRTIIAGSRDGVVYQDIIEAVMSAGWIPSVVVCGMCRGADLLGKRWADERNIPVEKFPAEWRVDGVYDNAAGHKRNAVMAKNAEALIAIWDGESSGTQGMIKLAEKAGLAVHIWKLTKETSPKVVEYINGCNG